LFDKSYFVSKKSSCPFEYRDLFKQTFQNETSILKAIARTTAMLHENGFLHKDYSGGNILFKETDGEIQVEIIDLNRMSFGKINMRTGCKNFERLNGNEHIYSVLGEEYANVRGFDKEKCIRLILEATCK
jgi:serine/threonine protein kinase